jgi:small-conductance mechanosensitive channel
VVTTDNIAIIVPNADFITHSVTNWSYADPKVRFRLPLGVWTAEMTHRPGQFRSDLYFDIEKTLRENQIEIPFPQRDLHLRSGALVLEDTAATKPVVEVASPHG